MNKIWKLLPVIATTGIVCPLVTVTSCNKNPGQDDDPTTFIVSYGVENPEGLTWVSKPTLINKDVDLTVKFTLETGYSLVQADCKVLVGGKDVKSSCKISTTSIKVPASVITSNVSITIATTYQAVECKINYMSSTNIVWDSSNPTKVNAGSPLDGASYTISGENNIIDSANCVIKSGSIDITAYATFSGGKVSIPGDYITADITITLATKTDSYDGSQVPVTTGVTQYTAAEIIAAGFVDTPCAVAHYIYMYATSPTNGEINITLSGNLSDTQILIAKKGTYNITLKDVTISNSNSKSVDAECPILVDNANAIVNLIIDGNNNHVNDARTDQTDGLFDSDACIKSKGSLTIKGSGTLNINDINSNKGSFSKGIQVTKSSTLTVCETVKLNIFSLGTCLQSAGPMILKDSPTIVADSYLDSGLKTKLEDPDGDTKAVNLKRDITIQDSVNLTIYSARNGINSGHDFTCTGTPTITIKTSTNAGTKVGSAVQDEQNMFVMFSSSSISSSEIENMFFTCTFADSTQDKTTTELMTLKKVSSGGMGAQAGVFYKCDRPLTNTYTQFRIEKFSMDQFTKAPTERIASATSKWFTISNGSKLNNYDTISASISGSTISSSDSTFSKNYKDCIGQKASIEQVVGSKGIKADNTLNANAGTINIESVDTGLQASYGQIYVTSTNGYAFGAGDINIAGANITVKSTGGDGAKGYGKVTVSNGLLNVTQSVEALEGGLISIEGGVTKLVASDDGVNASSCGKYYPSSSSFTTDLRVSGGVLDVQINTSGDTDAIDSNKAMTISGGLVITRNLSNAGGMSSALDTEENIKMTGGTLVAMGTIEKTIETTGVTKGYAPSSPTIYYANTFTITYNAGSTYTFTNNKTMSNSITIYYPTGQSPSFTK